MSARRSAASLAHSASRGSAADRRRRKQWLLDTFGDGVVCVCWSCCVPLDFDSVTVDRITPGWQGGRYTRDNIRPQCEVCAHEQGAQYSAESKACA